ncbi:MAG: cobH [Nitrososphaeraceae archaeon]|nr:cobH [Nitrososphaeraceae archaeon]
MSSPGNTRTEVGREEMSERAIDIEKLSFEIIDAEIGSHGYNELEWPIVRRVIHATADFDFARKGKIIFHNNPIDSAFNAIKNKCNIVTDVDMVLSALNKKSIADLGLKSACYISDKTLSDNPVGFVSASESKDELRKIDTPFISNVGRKGGSPAAASIVNAIMLLYKTKS